MKITDRVQRIRSLFDTHGPGLEIGPSHSPIMPKSEGYDVRIFDYMSADGLRQKYAKAGTDVSQVEEVDYLGSGGSLLDVIEERHVFSWIVASHVVEHVPDFLRFMVDCESLLRPTGNLILIVPDKRCCFDILRPVSTIGQVLQANVDQRSRPSPGSVFDDLAYARLRNGQTGWPIAQQGRLGAAHPIEHTWNAFERACKTDDYMDVHCWTFVPASFRLIVSALYMGGKIGLSLKNVDSVDGEFYAVLNDSLNLEPLDLGELAIAAQIEERRGLLDQAGG